MPKISVFGDVHGHLSKMIESIDQDINFALQVGDFGVYLPTSNLSSMPERFKNNLGEFPEYFENQKP